MKEKYDQAWQLMTEGRLIDEAQYQLLPIEAWQDTHCNAAVVNLFYQNESANEADFDIDAVVDEAWDIVNQETSIH